MLSLKLNDVTVFPAVTYFANGGAFVCSARAFCRREISHSRHSNMLMPGMANFDFQEHLLPVVGRWVLVMFSHQACEIEGFF